VTPALALLGARGEIGLDDIALIVFFAVVALLRLLQKVLKRGEPGAERKEGRPRGPAEEDAEGGVVVAHPAPHRRAPAPEPPAERRPASTAAHLVGLQGIARGERADLSRREAEPEARAAARPSGRRLLLSRDLPPPDRLRQAVAWSEVLRRPRPLRAPPPRR
jgi:hypothetical protein